MEPIMDAINRTIKNNYGEFNNERLDDIIKELDKKIEILKRLDVLKKLNKALE
ncbi:MAG: hypothetical protein ACTSRP_15665 [Candidatus Helarchaeota archaeon]